MRRVASVFLLVLGGWMIVSELLVAFMDVQPGKWDSLFVAAIFVPISGAPLLAGALISPGQRWQELGLTILLSAGAAAALAACMVAVMLDPRLAHPMSFLHEIRLDLLFGAVNWLAVAAFGCWLYRRQPANLIEVPGHVPDAPASVGVAPLPGAPAPGNAEDWS